MGSTIQTLFYFAGFITFLLACVFLTIAILMILASRKKLDHLADVVEEKMNQSVVSMLLPFLPALIALFGGLKKNSKK